jgi:hypothetical protein
MSDKKPIIKILFYKTKEAYFGLSADERKQLAINQAPGLMGNKGQATAQSHRKDPRIPS